jgi:hypothetical protein
MADNTREIIRLEALRKSRSDAGKEKLMPINLFDMMGILTDEQKQKKNVIENYYNACDAHIAHKIKFWKQYQTGEMEANILIKMNETMMEWIEATWEYFGQADIKEQSDTLKKEYAMFKRLFEECKIKEPAKKKTRRGGKKHKK